MRRRIARDRRRRKRRLALLAFLAVLAASGAGAAWAADADVLAGRSDDAPHVTSPRHAAVRAHLRARGPLPGALLIADRGNDRILLVNPAHRVLWRFPTPWDVRHGIHLNFNDDGFVASGGQAIVANEEEAHTLVSIDIRTHSRIHLYGVPGVAGAGRTS
jgi:hypothetical protein